MTLVYLRDEHPEARNEETVTASEILKSLLKDAPEDFVTLDWLMVALHGRSSCATAQAGFPDPYISWDVHRPRWRQVVRRLRVVGVILLLLSASQPNLG